MGQTSLGVDENIAALLSYVLGWISGLIVLLVEKENAFVRFHAMQSIITFGALTILSMLLSSLFIFFIFLLPLVNLGGLVLWIFLMVKAYQGQLFKLPVVGDMAQDWAKKIDI
jgi:uncharacterized membrane protein